MGSGRFCTVCGTVWKGGTWRCVFACTSTVRSLILRDTLLVKDQDSCTFHDLWYGSVDNLFHGALLDTLLWNQSHNFNDLLFDLRANSIVACVSRSGRNYRRLPFLRESINFFPDILSSSVYPHSRTRSSPCSLCPGRTALYLLSLDFRRCADDGKFVLQLGLQLTSVHPSLLAGTLRIVSFDSSNLSIGLLLGLDSLPVSSLCWQAGSSCN